MALPVLLPQGIDRKDILKALPGEARQKLQRFSRICERANAEIGGIRDRISDLRSELGHHQNVRRQARFGAPKFRHLAEVETEREKELISEIQELELAASDARKAAAPYRDITSRCVSWCENVLLAGGKIVAVSTPVPSAQEDYPIAVVALRKKISAVKEQVTTLERAPALPSELKRLAADYVARLARDGEPPLFSGTRSGVPVRFHSVSVEFVAWALGSALVERVNEMIDAANLQGAVGTTEREKKLAKLSAELLTLERQEEFLVEAAEKIHVVIERRPEADPRAILGITDE
jgi:hypothetical protein